MIRGFHSHLELCHYKAIKSQYSAQNAWNVNFNNSNVNNNTKSNTHSVRAFSDCQLLNDDTFQCFFEDMLVAYYECRKRKRSSGSEIEYEMRGVSNTLYLALDIYTYKYVIGKSLCFIVFMPTIREVFCAMFRDRIVHTWIALRLEPMLDAYLPDAVNANRKRRGTSGAVKMCYDMVQKDGWLWKFDIQGFFMAIDKRLLWERLEPFAKQYTGWDRNWFMYALELSLFNCPQHNCVRICPIEYWDRLPDSKSAFGKDEWHCLPIGDLLSQMLAGFFIAPFIFLMLDMGYDVVNYVDDTVSRHDDKDKLLEDIPFFRRVLKDDYHLTLHPKKCYIQHTTKGVTFLGAIIKRNRTYCGHRTIKSAFSRRLPRRVLLARESVNSYLGYFRQFFTFNIRKRYAEKCFHRFHDKVSFDKGYSKMIIDKDF